MGKINELLKSPHIKEICSYLIFGVLTTGVNLISFIILSYLGIYYMANTITAWFLAVLFAFYTNRKYVFKSNDKSKIKEDFVKFSLSRIASMFLDLIIMFVLVDVLLMPLMTSKLIDNIFIIIINYVLSKFLIFKD